MGKTRAGYPPAFRRQMVELVRAGRSPEELHQLRRENRRLRLEREILSKAAAWFARETNTIPPKGSGS